MITTQTTTIPPTTSTRQLRTFDFLARVIISLQTGARAAIALGAKAEAGMPEQDTTAMAVMAGAEEAVDVTGEVEDADDS